jgi:hypothetical protein
MSALAIAGCDVVVIIAKAINNAVDIPTVAHAIAIPFGMDNLLTLFIAPDDEASARFNQYSTLNLPRVASRLEIRSPLVA